jgi:HopA1 effector protein family
MDRADRRRHLVACVREELYASFYCAGAPVPARWGKRAPVGGDPELCAELSSANSGHGTWEPGWIVHRCDHDEAIVSGPRVRVRVPPADCRVDGGGVIAAGAGVSLRLSKELPALSPGFFMLVSDAPFDAASGAGVVRVYWHVTASGAPPLVRALTTRLNTESVPFRLKLADHPALFGRCDPAVLYLPVDTFGSVTPLLREVADSLRARLHPRIPAFTLGLAPGVGLAESAGTGQSFGISRCVLLAEGIVNAHEQRIHGTSARVVEAIGHLAASGVEIDAPYLDPRLSGRHVL